MKAISRISFLIVIGLFALGACSEKSASDNEENGEVNLEFWTINLKKDYGDYFENLISEYEEEHNDVKINWVDIPGDDVKQKFISELSSDDVPDVVNLSSFLLLDLPDETLYPISELVDDSELNQYFPNLLDSLTYDGEVLGVPWYNGGPPIGLLNEEVYKEAGLDPDNPPQNWDELLDNGKAIHENESDMFGSNDFPSLEILMTNDIELLSDDGKEATFNTDEAVKFVDKFIKAYDEGSIAEGTAAETKGANATNVATYQQTLGNGLIGQNGRDSTTHLPDYEENAPNQFPNFKVFPSVTNNDEYAIKYTMSFVIPKESDHPEEAADFALYVTNAENQLEFSKEAPVFPSTEETLDDEYFTDIGDDTIEEKARSIQIDSLSDMVITNIDEELRNAYRVEIAAAMMGEKTTEEALDDAAARWNEELSKNE